MPEANTLAYFEKQVNYGQKCFITWHQEKRFSPQWQRQKWWRSYWRILWW